MFTLIFQNTFVNLAKIPTLLVFGYSVWKKETTFNFIDWQIHEQSKKSLLWSFCSIATSIIILTTTNLMSIVMLTTNSLTTIIILTTTTNLNIIITVNTWRHWGWKYIWLKITQSPLLQLPETFWLGYSNLCESIVIALGNIVLWWIFIVGQLETYLLQNNKPILSWRKKEICSMFIPPLLLILLNVPVFGVVLADFCFFDLSFR